MAKRKGADLCGPGDWLLLTPRKRATRPHYPGGSLDAGTGWNQGKSQFWGLKEVLTGPQFSHLQHGSCESFLHIKARVRIFPCGPRLTKPYPLVTPEFCPMCLCWTLAGCWAVTHRQLPRCRGRLQTQGKPRVSIGKRNSGLP